MMDNDPKHSSKYAANWMKEKCQLWKTPPESPDLNAMEKLWHELKEYIRRVIKPTIKQELVDGIRAFWETVYA